MTIKNHLKCESLKYIFFHLLLSTIKHFWKIKRVFWFLSGYGNRDQMSIEFCGMLRCRKKLWGFYNLFGNWRRAEWFWTRNKKSFHFEYEFYLRSAIFKNNVHEQSGFFCFSHRGRVRIFFRQDIFLQLCRKFKKNGKIYFGAMGVPWKSKSF